MEKYIASTHYAPRVARLGRAYGSPSPDGPVDHHGPAHRVADILQDADKGRALETFIFVP
jgi:hypothetical protein